MPKNTFQNGSPVPAEWFNAIQNLNFQNTDNDGSYPPITDNDLTNAAGNIKPEWRGFRDTLLVTAGTGLSVSYTGGSVTLPNGTIQTIAAGSLSLPANTTSIIHITPTGTIAAATSANLPLFRLPLASVTTGATTITGAILDLRPRFMILPRPDSIKAFGGLGDQGDYTLATGNNATFSDGVYYFNNFTIAGNLTISQFARIFCSGTVNITGTITVTTIAAGGLGFGTGAVPTPNIGGLSGSGIGAGSGSGVGRTYSYAAQPFGSGGGSGFFSATNSGSNGSISSGGEGGGGLWIESAGPLIVSGAATINAIGGNALAGSVSGNPSNLSGGGGGSGGTVILSSLQSVSVAGTISVRGGNGANGIAGVGHGGGGGGGGQIVLIGPTTSTTGSTLVLTGGNVGTSMPSASLGGGTGGGNGGTGGSSPSVGNVGRLTTRNFRAVG